MKISTGIDIINLDRITAIKDINSFLARFYTESEIDYIQKRANRVDTIAGILSAKEAVSKSLMTGFRGFTLKDIEILHDENNRPFVNLINGAKLQYKKINGQDISISISHTMEFATAMSCILYEEKL